MKCHLSLLMLILVGVLIGSGASFSTLFLNEAVQAQSPLRSARRSKTVVLVRHAQKSGDTLTPAGKEQARKLRDIFRDVKVDAIVASTLNRTLQTVKPLAERDPDRIIPIARFGTTAVDGNVDRLVAHLKKQPTGSLTVVAHHSPTIPVIVTKLGVPRRQATAIDTNKYNNLIVLFLRDDGETIFFPMRGQSGEAFPAVYLGTRR